MPSEAFSGFRRHFILLWLHEENYGHHDRDYAVNRHRYDGFFDDGAFRIVDVQYAAHSNDVVDANHVKKMQFT